MLNSEIKSITLFINLLYNANILNGTSNWFIINVIAKNNNTNKPIPPKVLRNGNLIKILLSKTKGIVNNAPINTGKIGNKINKMATVNKNIASIDVIITHTTNKIGSIKYNDLINS